MNNFEIALIYLILIKQIYTFIPKIFILLIYLFLS